MVDKIHIITIPSAEEVPPNVLGNSMCLSALTPLEEQIEEPIMDTYFRQSTSNDA